MTVGEYRTDIMCSWISSGLWSSAVSADVPSSKLANAVLSVARFGDLSGLLIRINRTSKEYSTDLRHMLAAIAVKALCNATKLLGG
jgi:hypothetical protein